MHRPDRRLAALLALVLCGVSASLAARPASPHVGAPASATALAAQIDAVVDQPRFDGADWGIAVLSLDSGHMLYARRADHRLQPASTAKLFTAALTLDSLGADRRTSTRLLTDGTIRRGRLDGDLVLYGRGDPTLGASGTSVDWADQLAGQLVAQGINRIDGQLIADDSYFSGPLTGSGWEVADLLSWFAVPSSALSVQENVARLTVTPAAQAGGYADVTLDPALAIPTLISRIVTGAPHARSDINLYRAPGSDTLHAFGSVPAGAPATTFHLAMVDPARMAGEALREALARRGVKFDGPVRVLHWPEDDRALLSGAALLGEVASPTLGDILQRGLKRSQNLYLQNLLLMAGVQARTIAMQSPDPPPGFVTTEAWGIRALHALLQRIGIADDQVMLEEGSGLSRQDLVTPRAVVQLLQYAARQPYADTLRDALPVAGVDGTLVGRMRGSRAAANVHAKTGSMNFVNCLAGYVTTAAGGHLAFAIMLNNDHSPAGAPPAHRAVDTIAELLANYRGPR